jgi:hypothetical protein
MMKFLSLSLWLAIEDGIGTTGSHNWREWVFGRICQTYAGVRVSVWQIQPKLSNLHWCTCMGLTDSTETHARPDLWPEYRERSGRILFFFFLWVSEIVLGLDCDDSWLKEGVMKDLWKILGLICENFWVCEGFVQKLGLVWECYFHPLRLRPGGTVDENETKQKKQKNKNKILENK